MSANEKAWLPQTGVDKVKVLEMLNNTVVGKKAEAEERNKYAISLKKLHSLSNILRGQGYPVSFRKNNEYTHQMLYLGNPVVGFIKRNEDNGLISKNLEFPVDMFFLDGSMKSCVSNFDLIIREPVEQKKKEADTITAKSEKIDDVINARKTVAEYGKNISDVNSRSDNHDAMLIRMTNALNKVLNKNMDSFKVDSEKEFLGYIAKVAKTCKEYQEKGLFTISNERIDEADGMVEYKRQILGSLYDSLKITEQVVKYPALKK